MFNIYCYNYNEGFVNLYVFYLSTRGRNRIAGSVVFSHPFFQHEFRQRLSIKKLNFPEILASCGEIPFSAVCACVTRRGSRIMCTWKHRRSGMSGLEMYIFLLLVSVCYMKTLVREPVVLLSRLFVSKWAVHLSLQQS